MSESSDYTWYIDTCGDSRTNECITQMLVGATEEAECWEQTCEDNVLSDKSTAQGGWWTYFTTPVPSQSSKIPTLAIPYAV